MSRTKPGYAKVADQLRRSIEDGLLPQGTKLPSESELAKRFDTSRSTVREALRLLAAWNLVRVVVGRNGGSFVGYPNIDQVIEVIGTNIGLLTATKAVTLESVLEARELIEVRAAALAASRCSEKHLREIEHWLLDNGDASSPYDGSYCDQRFHFGILEATRNPMLLIATQPLLDVMRSMATSVPQSATFRRRVGDDHRAILEALRAHDPEAAAAQMAAHLHHLRPYYVRRKNSRARKGGRALEGGVEPAAHAGRVTAT